MLNQPKRPLVRSDSAGMVPRNDIPRSQFLTRHTNTTSFDAGWIVPIHVEEIYPGDQLSLNVGAFVRMATPLFPIFDTLTVSTFMFFTPNRLVWENWAQFMGELPPGQFAAQNQFAVPQIRSSEGGFRPFELGDYFGLPVFGQLAGANTIAVNALPFRAYALIYNEWFRDQNLIAEMPVYRGNDEEPETAYSMQLRAKYRDYFTSALPWPQKAPFAAGVPLRGQAPVRGIGYPGGQIWTVGGSGTLYESGSTGGREFPIWTEPSRGTQYVEGRAVGGLTIPAVFAELSNTGGITVEDLRRAFMVQSMWEKDARGGTRYVEKIMSHFGVQNPDYRLQRPEYIGGGKTPIVTTPVAQTARGNDGTTVGALGAASTAFGSHSGSYAATEHGWVHVFINVQSDLSYSQGVARQWSRKVQLDYMFPSLVDLGEQAIKRGELFTQGNADDELVFGYQERFAELRMMQSYTTGKFRPGVPGTLDAWHLGQRFANAPVLNGDFISDQPPMFRVLAAGQNALDQQFLASVLFERRITRALPTSAKPAIMGRF